MELTRRHALAGAAAGAAAPLLPTMPAGAAAPIADKQAPSYYRYKVGDILVTVVSDGKNVFRLEDSFVANAKKEEVGAALEKAYMPHDMMTIYFAPLVINTGGKLVVLDTGNGPAAKANSKGANGLFADNFVAAGFDPKAVDMVVISHFHGDHVNGLVTADGAPAFPNAEVLVPATEWKFWMDEGEMSRAPAGRMQALFKNNRSIFEAVAEEEGYAVRMGQGSCARTACGGDYRPHARPHVVCAVLGLGEGIHPVRRHQQSEPVRDASGVARLLRPGR